VIIDSLPSWISNLPEKSGYLYAMGISQLYFNEVSSWLESERDARLQLALSLGSQEKTLNMLNNGRIHEVSKSSIDQILKDIQVVGRSKSQNIFYVLIRMKI